jgi:hypothetical protein
MKSETQSGDRGERQASNMAPALPIRSKDEVRDTNGKLKRDASLELGSGTADAEQK